MDERLRLLKYTKAYRLEPAPIVQVFERKRCVRKTKPARASAKRRYTRRKASTPF